MSVRAMTRVWETDLKSGPKFVLLALADHADDEGYCYPSVDHLAEKTGMGESTVRRHLDNLVANGHLLKVARRRGPMGGLRTWMYRNV
jgi:DNA-binding IscR family transcriptional regulator